MVPNVLQRVAPALTSALLVMSATLPQAAATSDAPGRHSGSDATTAKAPTALSSTNVDRTTIRVKFDPRHDVRIDGDQAIASYSTHVFDPTQRVLESSAVAAIEPLFPQERTQLQALTHEATTTSGSTMPDLAGWFSVNVAEGQDPEALLHELRNTPGVQTAYFAPAPVAPPIGDLTSKQVYLAGSASHGVDATYAHSIPGGTGKNVTIADVEFGWTTNHEDISRLRNAVITEGTPRESYSNHGTAVMGIISGDKNGRGVTGIAHDATVMLSHATTTRGFNPAAAIVTATRRLSAGDVLVLEQQASGCGGGYAPVEVIPAAYDAIKAAVGKGIHVVQAAGNGAQNLDDSCYGGASFPGGRGDSGSIIVGAGASSICGRTPGSPMSFSTFGSRVNVHGWGECVYSAGYGDLQGGSPSQHYTRQFSGTSSATPVVAGAVAVLASIAKERGATLNPAAMRDLIVRTGTPQANSPKKIGPLPNLRAAIAALPGSGTAPQPGNPAPDPVVEPSADCTTGYATKETGTLTSNAAVIHPGGKWYETKTAGEHVFCLSGPDGADFDLYVQQWQGEKWEYVAEGTTDGAREKLTHNGPAGFYRVVAFSPFESEGAYTIAYSTP